MTQPCARMGRWVKQYSQCVISAGLRNLAKRQLQHQVNAYNVETLQPAPHSEKKELCTRDGDAY